MVTELINRIRRVRIRQAIERIDTDLYLTCPHWWAWWIPNNPPVWQFIDDEGNIHSCNISYGTDPTIIITPTEISGGIWFGAPEVHLVYGHELDTRTKDANRPTLFVLYEHKAEADKLSYPSATASALLVIPQSSKWSAELSSSIHNGMLSAISDIMNRALVDILDATWVPSYNPNLLPTGSGLPGEANTLVLTLRWRNYR